MSSDGQRSKYVVLNVREHVVGDAVGNREVRDDLIEAASVRRSLRPLFGDVRCELPQAIGWLGIEVEDCGEPADPPELHVQNRNLCTQVGKPRHHGVGESVFVEEGGRAL